jgi:hypothetical protein
MTMFGQQSFTKTVARSAWVAGVLAVAWIAACGDSLDSPGLDASAQGRDIGQPDASVSPDVGADLADAPIVDAAQVADAFDSGDGRRADLSSPSDVTGAGFDASYPPDAAAVRVTDAAEERPVDSRPLLDGAGGGAQVVLRKSYAWADCMPAVGGGWDDPVMVTWTVDIAGARGDTARVSKGTLTVVGAVTIVQNISVDKPTVALSGGAGSAEQRKPLPGTSPNDACMQICGAGKSNYRLELVFEVDGRSIAVESSGSFVCAY